MTRLSTAAVNHAISRKIQLIIFETEKIDHLSIHAKINSIYLRIYSQFI